ncbi:MAG: leucine-rich repeat domain-containing protein [Bacteroidaceae bacterium]|nr:leucine-rich repeat domain-containing protein [Bacteroidaceae bacterium]
MSAGLWAQNNVITYTAPEKAPEVEVGGRTEGIALHAFNAEITSHTFSNGVGTITFAEDVKWIGKYALYLEKATSITIPASVDSIGDHALAYSSYESIIFAEGSQLRIIEDYAFYYCKSLTSIEIPEMVTEIGTSVFFLCSSLKWAILYPTTLITMRGMGLFPQEAIYVPANLVDAYKEEFPETPDKILPIRVPVIFGENITVDPVVASGDSVNYLSSVSFTAADRSAAGYKFDGFFSDEALSIAITEGVEGLVYTTVAGKKGVTVYAKYTSTTVLPKTAAAVKATKVMTNGQVIFRAENKNYTILGQEK